jgi:glycosyltransferase involved in cell wall biosynthesis
LCNLYPAVSHSFVRREIEAVERAGHEVHRFSLRPPRDDLKDEADLREAVETEVVLGRGVGPLISAALGLFLLRPVKSVASLAAALRLAGPGLKQKARHVAYWLEAAWLLGRLERLRIEHLHAHFGTNPAAIAAIARAWGGPPYSFTAHGPDEFDAPVALSLPAKIEAASFVIGISSYGCSQLMRWCEPEHWNKIELIRCGLGADFLGAPVDDPRAESAEFVCVARLSGQKGLPLLIAACDRLRSQGADFSLTIIGDGELRDSLDAEIRRRKLETFVNLAGIRTSSEIREHLTKARAFVLPSFAEGLPVVLMEALALSRPVIATSIAGIPELVDDECGWIIPAGSEDALVEAMTNALRASARDLAGKGAVGRRRVHRMHDAVQNAAQLIEAITRQSNAETICTQ